MCNLFSILSCSLGTHLSLYYFSITNFANFNICWASFDTFSWTLFISNLSDFIALIALSTFFLIALYSLSLLAIPSYPLDSFNFLMYLITVAIVLLSSSQAWYTVTFYLLVWFRFILHNFALRSRFNNCFILLVISFYLFDDIFTWYCFLATSASKYIWSLYNWIT